MSQFSDSLEQLKKAARIINLPDAVVAFLSNPTRIIDLNIPLKLTSGNYQIIKGFRVQYNNWMGPYKGGLRYHQDVDMEEVKNLAFLIWALSNVSSSTLAPCSVK